MSVEILNGDQRWLLLAVALILGTGAAFLRWGPLRQHLSRRWRDAPAILMTIIATVALVTLVADGLVTLMVARSGGDDAGVSPDYNQYQWILLAPWGRTGLALGVGAVIAVVLLSWRGSRHMAAWRRTALVGLRSAAALTALVLFLEPAVELRQVAREPNRIAILVDDSHSMTLREDPDGESRQQRARALMDASSTTLEAWRAQHHLDFFSFSDALLASSSSSIAAGEAGGAGTLTRLALEQVRSRYDGHDLAGVILISDGIPTGDFADGADDGAARDFLRSLTTRVHTVWVGRPGLKDTAITRILADEFAFVRTVVRIKAVVRSNGFGKRRVPVTLSSSGKAVRQKWVEAGPGETATEVVFEFTPPAVGKYVYELSTPVVSDEAVATNNTRSFVLRVIRDKIRVLQVAGQPSWDVHGLRRMLKQNPNVDLISFFILRTQDDVSLVPNHEMSLIPFPTRELFQQELPSFDLMILQNFEYQPYGIGMYLENIRSYVEGGGGLAMLGGSLSFASGGYAGSPVAAVLPIELPAGRHSPRDLLDANEFAPVLSAEGKLHPITSLRYETRDNLKTWAKLPKLEGVNIVGRAKKGASVLATHPTLKVKTRSRRGKSRSAPMPVLVAGEYGLGRSLALTTDSLWRWGFIAAAEPDNDGRHYYKFWENTIRWLIQDPELEYLHVTSDAVEYSPDAPIRLDVRLLDRDYTPMAGAEVSLRVLRGTNPADSDPVSKTTVEVDDAGEASYDLTGLDPGVHRVHASATLDGRKVEATDIFLVRRGSPELDRPAATSAILESIAAATGGRYLGKISELPVDLPFDEPRIIRVDQRMQVELWSRPALLLFALLFLGLGWLLRQRSGYL